MSLREFYACATAHGEYHGNASSEKNSMSDDRLAELGIDGFD